VSKILWLGDGIVGDDTDGHVDDLTRFVDASTVVTVVEEDPLDENYGLLQDNLARLKAMSVEDGTPLRVVELPARIGIDHVAQTHIAISCSGFHLRVCGSDRNKRGGKWCRNEEEMRPHAGPEGIDDGGPATIPYREAYLPPQLRLAWKNRHPVVTTLVSPHRMSCLFAAPRLPAAA
jgi:hypothetical protein